MIATGSNTGTVPGAKPTITGTITDTTPVQNTIATVTAAKKGRADPR